MLFLLELYIWTILIASTSHSCKQSLQPLQFSSFTG